MTTPTRDASPSVLTPGDIVKFLRSAAYAYKANQAGWDQSDVGLVNTIDSWAHGRSSSQRTVYLKSLAKYRTEQSRRDAAQLVVNARSNVSNVWNRLADLANPQYPQSYRNRQMEHLAAAVGKLTAEVEELFIRDLVDENFVINPIFTATREV